MADRARDTPMSPSERAMVARVVARNQAKADRKKKQAAKKQAASHIENRDRPMTPAERQAVTRAVRVMQRDTLTSKRKEAQTAFDRVLRTTGDRDRAERVRAKMLGTKPPVSPLTAKAAKSGKLPAASMADTAVRGKVAQAGIPVKVPGGGMVGQFGKDLVGSAVYTLPGLYTAGKAVGGDVADTARGRPTAKRTAKVAKAVGESTVDTVRHPLRHPGDTFLLGVGAVSGGAGFASRASAAASAAREAAIAGRGASVRAALTRPGHKGGSLLRKPTPAIRKVRVGDTEFQGTYSKNRARATVQKRLDERATRQAKQGKPEALNARAARFGSRQRMIEEDAGRAPELTVQQAGHKLTGPQQMAVRAVVEQTPLEHRRALAVQELEKASTPESRKRLRREVALIEAARPYVRTADDGTVHVAEFATPSKRYGRKGASSAQLRAQVDRVVRGGQRRERQGVELGVLSPETIKSRRAQPGQVAREAAESYRGTHRAPEREGGSPMHDLAGGGDGGVYPADVYGPAAARLYGHRGDAATIRLDEQTAGMLRAVEGKPEARVTVYRAVPRGVHKIEPGDWVTPNRGYARQHAESNGADDWHIVEATVPARELYSDGNSIHEFSWAPDHPEPLGYLGYSNRRARDVVFRPFASRTGAKPKPGPELVGSLKQSTGQAQRTGAYQHNTSRVAATGMGAMNRLHMAVRLNARLFAAGVKARPADTLRTRWVPVRDRDLPPAAMNTLRALSEKLEQDEPLSGVERAAYQRALEDLQPHVEADALSAPAGAQIAGVQWVPKRVFDAISQTGQPTSIPTHWTGRAVQSTWREFNAGLRSLVLYSKGMGAAYITPNLGANILLLTFQGGPKALRAAVRSLNPKFRASVGEDAWNAGRARMGEGFMTSTFAEQAGRGPVSAVSRRWAGMLGKVTDEQTRMASLVFEASERGYKTPTEFRDLMLNPKHADDAMDVTIRARDAALDYGLMTPAERSYVASWLFVYPFMRSAARYSVNFPLDHPYQAAVYSQLAQIARGNEAALGDRGTGRDAGLVQTGQRTIPGAGTLPVVRNVNALSPFTTIPEMTQTLLGTLGMPGGDQEGPLGLANPAVASAIETLAGTDSFTRRPVERNLRGFAGQVVDNIPAVQDVRQLRKTPEQLARQVSPRQPRDVLERQFLGSLAQRPYNVKKAQAYARRDREANLSPGQRARRSVFRERQQVFETVKEHDPRLLDKQGRLPEPVRQAYNRAAQVEAARARARDQSDGDSAAYYRTVAVEEAKLYERWGVAPKGYAADAARVVKTMNVDTLKNGVERQRNAFAPDAYRDTVGDARKYLERRAA